MKKVNTKKVVAWFISMLMILSVVGFIGVGGGLGDTNQITGAVTGIDTKDSYNGYRFLNNGVEWQLIYGSQYYPFRYHPGELEDLEFSGDLNKFLVEQRIYVIYDSQSSFDLKEEVDRIQSLVYTLNKLPQDACLNEKDCPDIPIKTCEDVQTGVLLQEGTNTQSKNQDNCVVLEANSAEDMAKLVDRFSYTALGVMR